MVGVAQLVELRIVAPAVVGSNPIAHPNISRRDRYRTCPFFYVVTKKKTGKASAARETAKDGESPEMEGEFQAGASASRHVDAVSPRAQDQFSNGNGGLFFSLITPLRVTVHHP